MWFLRLEPPSAMWGGFSIENKEVRVQGDWRPLEAAISESMKECDALYLDGNLAGRRSEAFVFMALPSAPILEALISDQTRVLEVSNATPEMAPLVKQIEHLACSGVCANLLHEGLESVVLKEPQDWTACYYKLKGSAAEIRLEGQIPALFGMLKKAHFVHTAPPSEFLVPLMGAHTHEHHYDTKGAPQEGDAEIPVWNPEVVSSNVAVLDKVRPGKRGRVPVDAEGLAEDGEETEVDGFVGALEEVDKSVRKSRRLEAKRARRAKDGGKGGVYWEDGGDPLLECDEPHLGGPGGSEAVLDAPGEGESEEQK